LDTHPKTGHVLLYQHADIPDTLPVSSTVVRPSIGEPAQKLSRYWCTTTSTSLTLCLWKHRCTTWTLCVLTYRHHRHCAIFSYRCTSFRRLTCPKTVQGSARNWSACFSDRPGNRTGVGQKMVHHHLYCCTTVIHEKIFSGPLFPPLFSAAVTGRTARPDSSIMPVTSIERTPRVPPPFYNM